MTTLKKWLLKMVLSSAEIEMLEKNKEKNTILEGINQLAFSEVTLENSKQVSGKIRLYVCGGACSGIELEEVLYKKETQLTTSDKLRKKLNTIPTKKAEVTYETNEKGELQKYAKINLAFD